MCKDSNDTVAREPYLSTLSSPEQVDAHVGALLAQAEARGLFRLFVSLSLTTLSCLVVRVASLRFCAFFRRYRVKRIQSV